VSDSSIEGQEVWFDIAFKVYKDAEVRAENRGHRKSLKALLDLKDFGIHTKSITKNNLWDMRNLLEHEKSKPFLCK
jgi:hypothetical protein